MDSLKQWLLAGLAACLAVLAAGWFLLVAPTRSDAAELALQADAQVLGNDGLRAELQRLREQAALLPQHEAALARVAAKVPADPALPDLVRALDGLAAGTGVELLKLAPGTPTAPVAPAPAAPADPAADPAATVPAPVAGHLTQPLAIEVAGGFYDVQAFVAGLEELSRAVRVTGLRLAPGANPVATVPDERAVAEGRSLTASVTAEAYVAVPDAVPGAAATPTDPTATAQGTS